MKSPSIPIRVPRPGFTLVEMLVVIAIIGVLIGMTLPALSAVRESARRSQCNMRLLKIGQAMEDYVSVYGALPAGTREPAGPIQNRPVGFHQSWTAQLLPYLEQPAAVAQLDYAMSVYDPRNAKVRRYSMADFVCPSAPDLGNVAWPASSYAGSHHDREAPIDADNNGLLFRNSAVRYDQITDGRAYTLLVGEKRPDSNDLGWLSGTRATLRNAGQDLSVVSASTPIAAAPSATHVGGFGSHHSGAVLFLLADGSVRPLGTDTDPQRLQLLANRADGELISWPDP
ncbi:MAG: DUF1559 domain-containing protein [Planctomycetes bacterium]|nr:DUF1559 domain-containing protein [Planctomycetota bacterium]